MRNYAVSMDDIDQALEYTSKDVLAHSIVLDSLGQEQVGTEKFSRHLAAYKNKDHTELVNACKPLVIKYSSSITKSSGCFLDEKKSVPIDFDGALKSNLENLVASLDSALTENNPAVSIINARSIVSEWDKIKIGSIKKMDLSNKDLSIELDTNSKTITITPTSKVNDSKLMEASPIINELSISIDKMLSRRQGREHQLPSLSM